MRPWRIQAHLKPRPVFFVAFIIFIHPQQDHALREVMGPSSKSFKTLLAASSVFFRTCVNVISTFTLWQCNLGTSISVLHSIWKHSHSVDKTERVCVCVCSGTKGSHIQLKLSCCEFLARAYSALRIRYVIAYVSNLSDGTLFFYTACSPGSKSLGPRGRAG